MNLQKPYHDVDTIVIGKHAKLTPETNDEVRAAFALRDRGAAVIQSFPEVLHDLTLASRNLVVAGSYGKSTTTALLAWILADNGLDPGYFIGAIPLNFPFSSQAGSGDLFILEGDEYPSANWDSTSKFLYYQPRVVVLTSCEYDHFNEFRDEAAYVEPYRRLVRLLPPDGLLVACVDGKHVEDVMREAACRVVTYSTERQQPQQQPLRTADYTVDALAFEGARTKFTVHAANGSGSAAAPFELDTELLGRHNVQNILGAAAALCELGLVTPEQIADAVRSFRGLRRRMELKTRHSSVPVYEDLSSSGPKAVAALRALRERYPAARLFAVFQPHTFSFRSKKAREWYPGMFADADEVLVFSPPELRGLSSEQELSHEEIIAAIEAGNETSAVRAVRDADEIVAYLSGALKPGDVVLLMTSGGMGGVIGPVIQSVEARYPAA